MVNSSTTFPAVEKEDDNAKDNLLFGILTIFSFFFRYSHKIKDNIFVILSIIFFWFYSNKFLNSSANYVTDMSRDLSFTGVQQNVSYYSMETLILSIGGFLLVSYLLIQNEIEEAFSEPNKISSKFPLFDNIIFDNIFYYAQIMPLWIIIGGVFGILLDGNISSLPVLSLITTFAKGALFGFGIGLFVNFGLRSCESSFFAMAMLFIAYFAIPFLDLSSSTQVPFFFIGGAVLTSSLLMQNNVSKFFSLRSNNIIGKLKDDAGLASSVISIFIFIIFIFQIPFFPLISDNLIPLLSLILLINVVFWSLTLVKELSQPSVQEHRTSSLIFMVGLPFFLYLLLRFMYLLHHPDTVMRNRWELVYDFMEDGNTFRVNTWPFEVTPGADSRWLFYKAAIINSARITLVSIFLCTILGVIVGVTRLSSNKLASNLATVYVELFRNLPLAVLLFLVATQMGHQLPMGMKNIQNIGDGRLYFNNQGIWFTTIADYSRLLIGVIILGSVKIFLRYTSRVQPRLIEGINGHNLFSRPFSLLGWKLETTFADILIFMGLILFTIFSYPFFTSGEGGLMCLIGSLILLYSFYVYTNVDDSGINVLFIDDTDEGIRKRLTIWAISISIASGIAISGGFSLPDLYQPSSSPGSWRILENTGFEITPPFIAMVLGLTLFTASVVAEIVRGSIQSLPRGQVEAAISLGLSPFQRLRLVILPQALRSMIPLLNNQFMNVWKNSSLAIIVAYNDIFYQFLVMSNNVGKVIPLFILLLVTYQFGSLLISTVMNWFNARVTSVKI
ncbi:MAG: ABC transporter permease subunit [Euryarchaeota archaeon]|nr:ABC transporter permease subunit [Euryarchaeota archaeon]